MEFDTLVLLTILGRQLILLPHGMPIQVAAVHYRGIRVQNQMMVSTYQWENHMDMVIIVGASTAASHHSIHLQGLHIMLLRLFTTLGLAAATGDCEAEPPVRGQALIQKRRAADVSAH